MTWSASSQLPQLSVVIVTFQSKATIARTLAPLADAAKSGQLECIIVDNSSSDGTADFIASEWPWVRLVRSGENLGFGRACNRGFEDAKADYVLFLNPDASIPVKDIEVLRLALDQDERACVVAPATIVGTGELQMAGMLLTPKALLMSALSDGARAFPLKRMVRPGEAGFATNWVCGAIMLFKSAAFRELGGFDQRFFLYFEETDLCLRALRKGYRILAVGEAVAEHVCGSSARASGYDLEGGCIPEHYYTSRFYYLRKNFGLTAAVAGEIGVAAINSLKFVVKRLARRPADSSGQFWTRPFLRSPPAVLKSDR
jgi:N-acetylglucosaminyl-diphospho-decaprenol L-rhamnosyltransferase